jgi:hypothetical protein
MRDCVSNNAATKQQEPTIYSLLVRGILIVTSFVTSLFVTRNSPEFGVMEMAVALLLFILVVAVLAFWPERWTHFLNRLHKPR